ncbi:hypothetical protein B7R21_05110 [Subtercola boreus]|uniref:HTH luxR-type domain-containing protein n=1 Tax=Subtercola boreus TaxID=120213 RepID=A0A3E0VZT1_9MICO|nr:hypothetical protein [Subtercola boreus]RFA15396.1 hypothetical protein B7R21_05110 [Subtercola boreus]
MQDDTLLAVIYRGRPATVAELAALSHLPEGEARAAVADLRARGLLSGEGDGLVYSHPALWAAQVVAERSAELRRSSRETLSELERIVAELPGMLRHWSVGETSTDQVPVITRHGRYASEDVWYDIARPSSGTLNGVLPDVDQFELSEPHRAERFGRALAAKDSVRVIMPTRAADDPLVLQRMTHYRPAGVEFRLLDAPASWFWVDGDHVGVPFAWGEGRPTGAIGVRNSALASLALAYFEVLWQQAEPAEREDAAWSPLLRLMRQGITLDTASRRVGINPRTGRRRIAAAMDHYGVSTLFALGVAWAADPQTTAGGPGLQS